MRSYRIILLIAFASQLFVRTTFAQLTTENYIKTYKATVALTGDLTGINDKTKVSEEVSYVNGLGMAVQKVSRQGTPLGYDLVSFIEFDEYGRVTKSYFPYATTATDGSRKSSMVTMQSSFYQGLVGASDGANAFSISKLEDSELNRIIKQGAPGLSWQPDATNTYNSTDHTVKYSYESNDASEVLLWTFQTPTEEYTTGAVNAYGKVNAGTAAAPIYYAASQLSKKKTKDEAGNQVIEYVDKEGRTILKRVQAVTGSPLTTDSNKDVNFASTYYIYNDLGNLVCVIPPEATTRLTTEYFQSGATDATKNAFLKRWAFRYRYDGRSRMILKQVPGAEPVYMIYDNRDRLVLTQDAVQRSTNKWTFTKYDALNRPVLTGNYTDAVNITQVLMQSAVDTYYNTLTATKAWFETFTGSGVHGYNNYSFPQVATPDDYLTVSYYDNYNFKTLFGSTQYDYKENEITVSGLLPAQVSLANLNNRVIGQLTGSKTRMLTAATWLNSVNYYDDKYRPVQVISENLRGHEVTTNVYDFVGKVLRTKTSVYKGQPASWTSVVNATLTGDLITGSSSTNWGAGAIASQTLPTGTDGWVEFTVVKTSPNVAFGLSVLNTNNNYTTVDFQWYLSGTTARPYQFNSAKGSAFTVSPGDVLRVERVNGNIYWKRNGLIVFPTTTPVPSSTVLLADLSLYNVGSAISTVRLSETFSNFVTTPQTIAKNFVYDHAGRLLETWHSLNNATAILLTKNEYNELGQLVDKKLHSTVSSGTDAKQSVDYRYNIRGWLTKINESDINVGYIDPSNSGEARDLFGMALAYNNTDLGIGNSGLFNGNISAMTWSNNLGLGATKQNGFVFNYDPMNRLTLATHKVSAVSSIWTAGQYEESITAYDQNGNIKALQRKGEGGVQIDNLSYNYGSGTTLSNKLLSVTDATANATEKAKGFVDGSTSGNDYTYDTNGNMLTDKNKNITAVIIYNLLNLPEKVARNNSSVTYLYDATGRKHSQVFVSGNSQKTTDYINAWVYENNVPQFVQHDEGRIALQEEKQLFHSDGTDITSYVPTASITVSAQTTNGETYVKVAPTTGVAMAKLGTTPIGGTFVVSEGQRYTYRVKGYSNSTKVAYLYVIGNTADLIWTGAGLPTSVAGQMWVEANFTIPNGTTQISLGLRYSSGTAAAADYFLINEVELIQVNTLTPEYQYNLKDHLGNVRLTFTTKDEMEATIATLETANLNVEQSQFLRVNTAKRINASIFDHTNGSAPTTTPGHAQRLNGSANEKYGLAKSISVMPGDVINAEVYAKYLDLTTSNWNAALIALVNQIAANAAGVVIDGTAYGNSTTSFPAAFPGLVNKTNNGAPKAYLNWLVFDRNYGFITGGFKQIGTTAKEAGSDVPHELLQMPTPITITQPGYVYIYLSNENPSPVEVYFDDFRVTHTKSPVIQQDDYYPFGLTFNSYSRENSVPNKIKFQGQEHVDDLGLNWDSFKWRNHQPDIGRFFNVDPLSEKYVYNSPYAFSENKVTAHVELEGLESYYAADGNLLGQVGSSTDVRVVNSTLTNAQATTHIQSGSAESTQALTDNSTAFANYFTTVADVTNDAALQTYSNNGNNCFTACTAQLSDAGVTQTGSAAAIQTLVDTGKDPGLTANPFGGAIRIQTELNKGNPVMVGVKETKTNGTVPDPGNANSLTGHFVAIRSVNVATNGTVTFNYLDNASTALGKNANNNLTLDTSTGAITDTTVPARSSYNRYDVTEVRKNQ